MPEAPRFDICLPAKIVKWAIALALVGVGGAFLLKYLYRDEADADSWYVPDGMFVVYAIVSIAVFVVGWIAVALVFYALGTACHCVLCCRPCRACCCRRQSQRRRSHGGSSYLSSVPMATQSSTATPLPFSMLP